KRAIYENGFVKLSGAVSLPLVHNALRAINASLGMRGMEPAQLTKFKVQTFCPELTDDTVIKDLLYASSVWGLAESAIGPGCIQPVKGGQIALRFPSMASASLSNPHLDGMYTPTNGVKQGT